MNLNKLHDVVFQFNESEPVKEVVPSKRRKTTNTKSTAAAKFKEIKAHKLVLANQSDVFEAMFYGSGTRMATKTNSDGLQVVKIEDIESKVFQFMIDCMYNKQTNTFTMTDDNLEKVAYAAEKYNFEELRKKWNDFMAGGLNIKNCIQFCSIARKYNIVELQKRALTLAAKDAGRAFFPAACKYADVEMWKTVLSSPNYSNSNISVVLNNAIYWATMCQGSETMDSVRNVLKPLQSLLARHVTKYNDHKYQYSYDGGYPNNQTPLHEMYKVFFPDLDI